LVALVGLLGGCASVAPAPLSDAAPGQRAWAAACTDFDEWDKSGPPFRVYGDTYYVGTCGISSLLIVSPDGDTLIDSGTDKGAEIVLANIRALGFDPKDVKVLLMSHEHFDHVGGMARLQAATGATIVATPEAASVLRQGLPGGDDPQSHSGHPSFPPVLGPITEFSGDDPLLIGGTEFRPLRTPGHTPGAVSWTWRTCEKADCKAIVYADSLNPISSDGYRFSDHPALLAAFRAGIAKVAATPCDIVLAPHPGSAGMRDRLLGAKPLVDPGGCRAYAAGITTKLDKRLADEAAGG
jgi:metallo-beta-lactamase class B